MAGIAVKQVTKVTADTIEELAEKLEGVNSKNFLETIAEYNKAVKTDVEFNGILDGRGTEGWPTKIKLGAHN